MSKLTLATITSGYIPIVQINSNFALIVAALENTLSRDGTSPNTLLADVDMNSKKIINLAAPINVNDAARLADVQTAVLGTFTNLALTGTLTAGVGVTTPLVKSTGALLLQSQAGGTLQFSSATGVVSTNTDNTTNLGDATHRWISGYFSTSVVTPQVSSPGALFLASGGSGPLQFSSATGVVSCNSDNTTTLGASAFRWAAVFSPIFDSGTAAPIAFKTNNGAQGFAVGHIANSVNFIRAEGSIATNGYAQLHASGTDVAVDFYINSKGVGSIIFRTDNAVGSPTQARIAHTASAVNLIEMSGGVTGDAPRISAKGTDTNVGIKYITQGTQSHNFYTAGGDLQVLVNATAGATRQLTLTGSNGGNPTLATTAGSLAITPAVVLGSTLTGPSNMLSPITNSLGADVALNNAGNYFDGPSVAQGTSGTWFVSGTVSVLDTTSTAEYFVKLWDGTTVIASTNIPVSVINTGYSMCLSGFISNPAGNLRMSVRSNTTTGKIQFNNTGNSKDSTITAIRIA